MTDYETIAIEGNGYIKELQARIAALEAALKPFADRATYADKYSPDREQMPVGLDDLRAASAAMEGK